MVDFNNEATISTPAADIVRVLILQRRADLFEALEDYKKKENMGQSPNTSVVKARLFSWFLERQPRLKEKLKEKEYNKIKELINSDKIEEILEAIYILNEELDGIKLTRIDVKKIYDSTRADVENKEKGL